MVEKNIDVFELVVTDYVPYVDPSEYGIDDFSGVNPSDYFITSGDAVSKAKFMQKEMVVAANDARSRFAKTKNKKQKQFMAATEAAAQSCGSLVEKLIQVRGTAIFLELEWRDHKLYCIPKNPRAKQREQPED